MVTLVLASLSSQRSREKKLERGVLYVCIFNDLGWWLSMKMEDSFLNKLQPLENFPKLFERKERFGTYNEKTLGFLLVITLIFVLKEYSVSI